MADYRVVVGHDMTLPGLNTIIPEPTGDPVAPVERHYGASGKIHDQGGFLRLHWDYIETPEEYMTLLEQFGLDDSDQENVTVYARNARLVWTVYNGIAHLPEINVDARWREFYLRDVDIYITDLEDIT